MKAKRTFEDWLGDLRELARDDLGMELEEVAGYDEEAACDAYRSGSKPKKYLRDLAEIDGHEEDLTEIMREL